MYPRDVVTHLFNVFSQRGHRSYGEHVTELQHGLQCATLAQQNGEDPALVVACLLHDYGHLLHDLGEDIAEKGVDSRHECIGANQLSSWFGDEVVEPIRMHADAKRYLCWKDPSYQSGLSEASLRSLTLQGGPMSEAEASQFENHPHFDRAIRLRRYDDQGKQPDMTTPDLEGFRRLVESLVWP